jgi:hypothetical protein
MMRNMIQEALNKELKFRYVLAESWFSSKENISFVHEAKKFFIYDIKQNRLVTKWGDENSITLPPWLGPVSVPFYLAFQRYLSFGTGEINLYIFSAIYRPYQWGPLSAHHISN